VTLHHEKKGRNGGRKLKRLGEFFLGRSGDPVHVLYLFYAHELRSFLVLLGAAFQSKTQNLHKTQKKIRVIER